MAEGNVTFIAPTKYENFQLNGVVYDLQSGLEKFYGGDPPDNISVKLGGQVVTDFSTSLRAGDVVLIVDKEIASGGFKGAK